ncbi:MAG: 4-hydroxy-tetrahydrodipicolinate reductase [Proteobacteria bacterium]|nr:4-hydroxy-tetrahydrodipicolinate reductase [Pseudomonadota bacterium]
MPERPVRAVVIGACGKMGRLIIKVIQESEGIELVGATERAGHPLIGHEMGETRGTGKGGVVITESLSKVPNDYQVIIDFTTPESTLQNLKWAVFEERAIVIGTTGFSPKEREEIERIASETRTVFSPNMSVGVNLLFKLISEAAQVLGDDYDVEIVEAHHRMKKDAPSGTALKMAEIVAKSLKRNLGEVARYERKGMIGERNRAGDIVGEHTVMFGGIGERVEFTHRALSRENFARGAVRAARWIVGQKKGLYDMLDVLGLK